MVSQRQVGVDTPDFRTGVREALNESVDVLVLSDVSDHRTIEMALEASKQMLILCRIDAPDIAEAIDTVVRFFPMAEHARSRVRLAEQLIGGVSLSPCAPAAEGKPLYEVTTVEADERVRQLIIDPERTALLRHVGDPSAGRLRVNISSPALTSDDVMTVEFGNRSSQR